MKQNGKRLMEIANFDKILFVDLRERRGKMLEGKDLFEVANQASAMLGIKIIPDTRDITNPAFYVFEYHYCCQGYEGDHFILPRECLEYSSERLLKFLKFVLDFPRLIKIKDY